MHALVAGIHVLPRTMTKDVDGRDKPAIAGLSPQASQRATQMVGTALRA